MRLNAFTNNNIKILFFWMSTLYLCACNNTYPPSKYIGIFDYYDGYKNGHLPYSCKEQYCGSWRAFYQNSDLIRVQGKYYAGKPDGVWQSFYPDGIQQSVLNIKNDIDYYPDGTVNTKNGKKLNYAKMLWSSVLLYNAPLQMSHFYEATNTEITIFLYPEVDTKLIIWSYIATPQKISKMKISADFDFDKKTLKNIQKDAIFGEETVHFFYEFHKKSLKLSLLFDIESIGNIKLNAQLPLHDSDEKLLVNELISYSFE